MPEHIIQIENINPVDFYGVNDANINAIRQHFPGLKIITRGATIKIEGVAEEADKLISKLNVMIDYVAKYNIIHEADVEQIMNCSDKPENNYRESMNDVLVHGRNGLLIKAKTINQHRFVESYAKNDLVFAIGPAGTGKTYTAVALAVRALKSQQIRKIILTRPAVEAGENLGFLPGDMKEKLDPYLQPLYDALNDMLPAQKLEKYLEDKTIQIAPLAYMRGRTLDHAVAILDEAQNASAKQLKMFLTRMGRNSKFIVTGDITQIDLPGKMSSGLLHAEKILSGVNGIDFIMLDDRDIVRHKLVIRIVKAYDTYENQKNS